MDPDENKTSQPKESLTDAEKDFIASLETSRKMAEQEPYNPNLQRTLSNDYLKAGDICRKKGQYAEAQQLYAASLEIRKKLVELDPDDPDLQRSLSFAYERSGDLFSEQDLLPEAKKAFNSSIFIRDKLARKDPDNQQKQRDLWVAFWRLSDIMERQGSMDALVFWRATYNVLLDMKKKGFVISDDDEQHFEFLKDIFG
jgi:tetratricopeptide (TPR) repeat protein